MSSAKGYIKVYRDVWDSWVWEEKPFSRGQAWIDLLMMVNHADREAFYNGHVFVVKRGSRITSLRNLAERWGWSMHKVSDFLNELESSGMIAQERNSKKTLISVVKYDFYQGQENQKGTVKEHSRNTEVTQKEITRNTEGNKQYIRKNYKDIKRIKENISADDVPPDIDLNCTDWTVK